MHHLRADFSAVWFPAPPGENEPSSGRGIAFRGNPWACWRLPSFGCGKPARRADVSARGAWGGGRRKGAAQPGAGNILLIGEDTHNSSSPCRRYVRARTTLTQYFESTLKYYKEKMLLPALRTNLFPQSPPSESCWAFARPRPGLALPASPRLRVGWVGGTVSPFQQVTSISP